MGANRFRVDERVVVTATAAEMVEFLPYRAAQMAERREGRVTVVLNSPVWGYCYQLDWFRERRENVWLLERYLRSARPESEMGYL